MSLGDQLGPVRIRIDDACQHRSSEIRIMPGMVLPEMSDTDHPGPKPLHRDLLQVTRPASVPP
jgi:hypothetical protein